MRNAKLLGESATLEAWFIVPDGEKSYSKILRLWSLEENKSLVKLINKTEFGRRYDVYRRSEHKDANLEPLIASSPNLDKAKAEELVARIQSLLSGRDGERLLFSAYALNEFIEQTSVEVYGDYLDAEWDNLYASMKQYVFPRYAHTSNLYRKLDHSDSILTLRPRSAAPVRAALESLTRDQLIKLSKLDERTLRAKPAVIQERVNSLLTPQEDLPKPELVQNALYVAFSRAVANAGVTSSKSHFATGQNFINYLGKLEKFLYVDPKSSRADAIPSSAIYRMAKIIMDSPEEFSPAGVSALAFSVSYPELFTASSRAEGRRFFVSLAEESDETVLAALKTLAHIGIGYRGTLPSVKEWESALKDDLFQLDLAPDALFAMMGFDGRARRQLSQDNSEFLRGVSATR